MFGRHMTLLALMKPGVQNYFSLVRPNTGESYFDVEVCSESQCKNQDSWAVHVQLGPQLDCQSHHSCNHQAFIGTLMGTAACLGGVISWVSLDLRTIKLTKTDALFCLAGR